VPFRNTRHLFQLRFVTISVNTVDKEAPRCRAKPIVLVDLIRESKAKEERREDVCVCVSIYRPAAHMLMTCVLETPKEYRTPGGVSPWASKLYKNPIAREKSSFVCVFANSRISTVLQLRSGGLLRKILFTAYSCSWSPFL
jgi:hypothetical protein